MSLKMTKSEQDQLDLIPSEQLIQIASNIGFSPDELNELRQIYCFAMDGRNEFCASSLGPRQIKQKNAGKEAA